MALKVGDNFSYQGKKPNFERDTFATLSEMRSFPTTSIDEGHISLVLQNGKRYKYMSSNTEDATLGKWRLVVDTTLDATSENPIQNKVIFEKFKSEEELFAQAISAASQSSTELINQTKEFLLGEDIRQRKELEKEIIENEKITASALSEIKEAVESNELVTAQALNDKVGQARMINGYDLSEDITLTKADVGLDKVDNTADINKPISTLQQAALDEKVDKRDGYDLMSSSERSKLKDLPKNDELQALLASSSASLGSHVDSRNNPHNVTADQIGLGNVDNTADINKPISTLQQAALDGKVDKTTRINGNSIGDGITLTKADIGLDKVDNTSDINKPISNAVKDAIIEDERIAAASLSEIKETIDQMEKTFAAVVNSLRNQIVACKIWKGTESEYLNLTNIDPDTLYVIVGASV